MTVTIRQRAARGRRGEEGASLVEYVLLLSLIVLVCVVSLAYFGTSVNDRFSKSTSVIEGTP